jgi:Fe2+ or Zn2+ uptake regulation protein
MKENRKNGTMPTLYGTDSSQWKGGISEINVMARSNKRLYDEWKYPILVRDEFKCVKCGSVDDLHIHHDKETMSEIVRKHIVDEEPKEFDLKKSISDKVV